MKNLTERSLELFLAYANDADNWSGTPAVGGNVSHTKEDRGNLSDLVKKGLVIIFDDGFGTYLRFTDAGKALAKKHGHEIYDD